MFYAYSLADCIVYSACVTFSLKHKGLQWSTASYIDFVIFNINLSFLMVFWYFVLFILPESLLCFLQGGDPSRERNYTLEVIFLKLNKCCVQWLAD